MTFYSNNTLQQQQQVYILYEVTIYGCNDPSGTETKQLPAE